MEVKEPVVEEKSSWLFFTSIWIVPFIALIIASWLVYQYYSSQGPEISIKFKNSGGLVAGQSVIKFRDVPVGKVEKIEINSDDEGVTVFATVNKDVEPFLNETTKFWIVKAKVDTSGIQGLDTLLSGSYINMYAKKGKEKKREFIGLENPYIDISDGDYYVLKSQVSAKVKETTPVYFKGMQVGEVDKKSLDLKTKDLIIVVRIYKKYTDLVNETTKFWIQSMVNLKLNDNQLDVNVAPLPTLLLGGIAFSSKFDKNYKKDYSKIYKLYENEAQTNKNKIKYVEPIYKKVLFKYSQDVSSIDVGMSIKYKGINIGDINKVDISFDEKTLGFKALCLGQIDISNFGVKKQEALRNFNKIIKKGVVAKLEKSLLTNRSVIVLEEDKNNSIESLKIDPEYKAFIMPTQNYQESNIIAQLKDLADKFSNIDLNSSIEKIDAILDESKNAIVKLERLLDNLNRFTSSKEFRKINKNINKSLKELNKTLRRTQKLLKGYGSDSLFGDKLQDTLKELYKSSEQTNRLLRKLNNKPNSLIFGE